MKTREGVADLDNAQGDTATTHEDKARVLNEFFSSVFTKEILDQLPPFEEHQFVESLTDMFITVEAVLTKLKAL